MKAKFYYPSFEAFPVFASFIQGKSGFVRLEGYTKTAIAPFTVGAIELLGMANNDNEAVMYSKEHQKTFCVHAADFHKFWHPYFININKIWNNLND